MGQGRAHANIRLPVPIEQPFVSTLEPEQDLNVEYLSDPRYLNV
jgi:hypothetical protein